MCIEEDMVSAVLYLLRTVCLSGFLGPLSIDSLALVPSPMSEIFEQNGKETRDPRDGKGEVK